MCVILDVHGPNWVQHFNFLSLKHQCTCMRRFSSHILILSFIMSSFVHHEFLNTVNFDPYIHRHQVEINEKLRVCLIGYYF